MTFFDELKAIPLKVVDFEYVHKIADEFNSKVPEMFKDIDKLLKKQNKLLRLLLCLRNLNLLFASICCGSAIAIFATQSMAWRIINIVSCLIVVAVFIMIGCTDSKQKSIEGEREKLEYEVKLLHLKYAFVVAQRKVYVLNEVYSDTHKIIDKLCEIPGTEEKINLIKKELGIDFSYLDNETKGLEDLIKYGC